MELLELAGGVWDLIAALFEFAAFWREAPVSKTPREPESGTTA